MSKRKSDRNSEYKEEVRRAVYGALAVGHTTFEEIMVNVGSPDPRLLKEVFDEITKNGSLPYPQTLSSDLQIKGWHARRLSAELPLTLPASDPMRSQWWFTLDSVVHLAERVWGMSANERVAFLGAPTVGFHYVHWFGNHTTILDADVDVINSLNLPQNSSTYDVREEIPQSLKHKHSVVLLDPPWYLDITELFIARAYGLLKQHGFMLCILPSRLTRPGLIAERTTLLNKLMSANFEVVALELDCVAYRVPGFEVRAYKDLDEFTGRQWRQGDLLVVRVGEKSSSHSPTHASKEKLLVFTRDARRFRVFLAPERENKDLPDHILPVVQFETSVSTRAIPLDIVAVWGTNKKGASIKDAVETELILKLWEKGNTKEQVRTKLSKEGITDAETIVNRFNECLELWPISPTTQRRRGPDELKEHRSSYVSILAAKPTGRVYPYQDDGFRLDFQRDRDRILWSHALKRLANKTQLFPIDSDDHLRRRLSHSIEVSQLASTITSSFGLDRDLTEAGAMVHDIGHTPFGHAGEFALDKVLNEIDPNFGGFNHYEHGVDTVRWLENVYRSPGVGGFPGLNLTKETTECIIKHTYHRGNEKWGQTWLIEHSKHSDIDDTSCHLEGQAVRIADKISYLISDLEDGIRMGIITYEELMKCRLFEHPPIDMLPSLGESLYDRFVSQRRAILKVIMEDILNSTDFRLRTIHNIDEDVRMTREYIVAYSDVLGTEIGEVWDRLQAGRLHKHQAVVSEYGRAARIVRDLLLLFASTPALVEPIFRKSHESLYNPRCDYIGWYVSRVGEKVGIPKQILSKYSYEYNIGMRLEEQGDKWLIPIENLVLAKDYVASLTDTTAVSEHRKNCAGLM